MNLQIRCTAIAVAGIFAFSTIQICTASAEEYAVTMQNIREDASVLVRRSSDNSLWCKPQVHDDTAVFPIESEENYQVTVTYHQGNTYVFLDYIIENQSGTLQSATTCSYTEQGSLQADDLIRLFDVTTGERVTSWKSDGTFHHIEEVLEEGHLYYVNTFISDNHAEELYFSVNSFDFSTIASGTLYGDVTLDGKVDISDAVLLSKATSGMVTLSDQAANNADCNADGELGMDDTMVLLRFLVHFINVLPTTE